jgi:hypothetical protein
MYAVTGREMRYRYRSLTTLRAGEIDFAIWWLNRERKWRDSNSPSLATLAGTGAPVGDSLNLFDKESDVVTRREFGE